MAKRMARASRERGDGARNRHRKSHISTMLPRSMERRAYNSGRADSSSFTIKASVTLPTGHRAAIFGDAVTIFSPTPCYSFPIELVISSLQH